MRGVRKCALRPTPLLVTSTLSFFSLCLLQTHIFIRSLEDTDSQHLSTDAALKGILFSPVTPAGGATYLDWLSEEIRSGRWYRPHSGAFCPPPSDSRLSLKLLPNKLGGPQGLIQTTQDFAWIYHKHGSRIKKAFDTGHQIKVTNRFSDGTSCRSELKQTGFLADIEQELGKRFNALPHPTNGLSVYRLSNPNGNLEPETEWVSESWHIDNFDNNGFKVIIYCSDVDGDNAPFEYQDPPAFVPVIPRNTTNWFANTRLNYIGPSSRVLGPAGSDCFQKQ